MTIAVPLLLSLAGLLLLAGGGELLVRGAIAVSQLFKLSLAVVGLTVVAAATSLPELAVSVAATAHGTPDVAVGNVVGSNIFNLAAILGLSALIFPPLRFRVSMIRFDVVVMFVAALLAGLFAIGHTYSRGEGIIFLVLLAGFLGYRARAARRTDIPPGEATASEIVGELQVHRILWRGALGAFTLVIVGTTVLTAGAELLVRGATTLATLAGVSDRVIALTLVSAGTGLPEAATAITAGIRKHSAVVVGNVIGSNIFNVFGILGVSTMIRPLEIADTIARLDVWVMLVFSGLLIIPAFFGSRGMSRVEGTIAISLYILYMAYLLR